ncbi:tetratricopeptide repeat protein [Embleya sp. NPDC005575]|uniref:tetratricopeptide repeat protein n=1 Tax=Embleya sp. NPDC005575 TaxID=3156892 RepID=UPI0033B573BE
MRWRRGRKAAPAGTGLPAGEPGRPGDPAAVVVASGDARARGGGTATTGHRGAAPTGVSVAGSGDASATGGGLANTGSIHAHQLHVSVKAREPVPWPLCLGAVPAPATAFQSRAEPRAAVDAAHADPATVVSTQVFSGGGGVGKTQLAASCARQAIAAGTELVVWADAADAARVIALYARAAHLVHAPGAGGDDAEADAKAFTAWLATTRRSWLVVLDDITDPDGITPWWPPTSPSGKGRVLATSRLRDPRLSGGSRTVVDIGGYTVHEADRYLRERLTHDRAGHLLDAHLAGLAEELGLLPLALAHAAAYMIVQDVTCAEYLTRFRDSRTRLGHLMPRHADTEGYGREVDSTLLLALDAARHQEPQGLANPALRLAALLDPAGHPRELWGTAPVLAYLTAHRSPGVPSGAARVDADQARAVIRLLHRYNLLTDESAAGPRAVRLHALTARAARETELPIRTRDAAQAAASALLNLWPDADHTHPDLTAVLRANTDVLTTTTGDDLWHSGANPVLFRAGESLLHMGLNTAAVCHWRRATDDAERLLGAEHPDTLTARGHLAAAYRLVEWTDAAITIGERVAEQRTRLLGAEHPDTLTAWAHLAAAYRPAGLTSEAITIGELVAEQSRLLLGAEHPRTLTAWDDLATTYRVAGRTEEAITIGERIAEQSRCRLGAEHPQTLAARANLATSYRLAGRTREAITIEERVAEQRERLLGPDHPHTLDTLANLATSYWLAGRIAEAVTIGERVAQQRERLLAAGHPDILTAWSFLAASYRLAGRTAEAITIEERVTEQSMQLHDPTSSS